MAGKPHNERLDLEYLKKLRRQGGNSVKSRITDEVAQREHKTQWTVFWRKNINLYIAYKLGINTYPFQHRSYYLMNDATSYFEIATRGTSKTFKTAVFALAVMLLYPYSKVVLTASTFQQGASFVEEKVDRELFSKEVLSPVLVYLNKQGYFKKSARDMQIDISCTLNNSTLIIVPCLDSARRLRATVLIAEEARLLKKSLFDSVFENMLQPRTAEYLSIPKYQGKDKYIEDVKNIYITSNRYKNEWFYRMFKKTFTSYFHDRLNRSRVMAVDIFTALKHGLKTKKWYIKAKATMNDLDFRMEVLNEALGEVDGAYFSLEMFQKNQTLSRPFIPPTSDQVISGHNLNRPKLNDEIRLLFVDFAFANSIRQENDNTVIGCMSIYNKGDKWYRRVEHIETLAGGKHTTSLLRIRELFWDYEADYIVYDHRAGGAVKSSELSSQFIHPERPADMWNSHGFTMAMDSDYHMATKAKLDDYRSEAIDPNAIPVLIPISATTDFNSNMWIDLADRLRKGEVELLIDDSYAQQELNENVDYALFTSEEKARIRISFIQTFYMINEAINLSSEWRNGKLFLSEPRNGTKDRIVALAYANAIASKIINKQERDSYTSDFDVNAWSNAVIA